MSQNSFRTAFDALPGWAFDGASLALLSQKLMQADAQRVTGMSQPAIQEVVDRGLTAFAISGNVNLSQPVGFQGQYE